MGWVRLEKHYGDAVFSGADIHILYSATLSCGPLVLPYASLMRLAPGKSPWFSQRLARLPLDLTGPIRARYGDHDYRWDALDPATPLTVLYEEKGGALRWQARMPRANVTGGDEAGLGYFETLSIDLWPGRWPIRTLHWGRFVGADSSLVWIVWEEAQQRSWLFYRGLPVALAEFDPARCIRFDGGELTFGEHQSLLTRPIAPRLALMGPLRHILPARIRHLTENKGFAPATLIMADGTKDDGVVIVEEVRFS